MRNGFGRSAPSGRCVSIREGERSFSRDVVRYLFNPLGLLSTTARSIVSLTHLAMIGSLCHALIGDQVTSLALAAISTYTSIHTIAILGPILVLLAAKGGWGRNLVIFGAILAFLVGGSTLMVGSWQFLRASLGSRYAVLVVAITDQRGLRCLPGWPIPV